MRRYPPQRPRHRASNLPDRQGEQISRLLLGSSFEVDEQNGLTLQRAEGGKSGS
jgi:hypothetical protein